MPAFVALLRGVNVGTAKRVPMERLREILAGLGYTGVATLLNSGNAVFRAPGGAPEKHASAIALAIGRGLKIEVPVIVKTAKELDAAVAENPYALEDAEHPRLLVAFTQKPAALGGLAAIRPLIVPPEELSIGKHAAYLYVPAGILKSRAGEALLGKAGKNATTRNLATALKLQALAREGKG